jgi:uncharacterized coiled-coil DUF342 family protein
MDQELEAYFKEIVSIRRQQNTLKARVQELVYILLPEVEKGAVRIDGASIYKIDAREYRRVDKKLLRTVLVEKYGEQVADDIIDLSTKTADASFATVAVRLLDGGDDD